ncbi:hypothetical protein PF010_g21400 [Phytophthora fragariae]|uniref:Uncharacterized protein n=1 Tax=Phytophthora fragariae TaxID=53985 RepID=A0A6A3JK75_9STRA|nr:hypothetical protein PF011_g17401 [Phytophthora fragariae]KAE9082923.1 hypothetical protein PF010_g21400 [Phytophthora fragariae]KAE9091665.1 hypothetical protein PF007_g18787 [Phytophthora fragariae]KAE9122690.1 hypothetical protein PF006_g17596 [Phytophthora fragariae]
MAFPLTKLPAYRCRLFCIWGYRSALVDAYRAELYDPLLDTELRRVLDEYDKAINALEKRGLMKTPPQQTTRCNEPQPGAPTCLRRATAVGDAGEVDGEDRRPSGVNRQDAGEDRRVVGVDRRDAGGRQVAGCSWSARGTIELCEAALLKLGSWIPKRAGS